MKRYTLAAEAVNEQEIRKSRFRAYAAPAETPAEALQFIQARAQAAATHNCWAYRVGPVYRSSDDGEPGGTAGRPILQAIDAQQCDRVAVLVARWFGGIKLGTGGLVRAYGGTAAECLRLADRLEIIQLAHIECHCPFAEMAALRPRLAQFGARIEAEEFDTQGVRWKLEIPASAVATLRAQHADLTRGQGLWKELEVQ
ncbi:IMPACT family protein [Candidimonas nitroreducens]|uniref:Thymidylate synthase n=1 Tax=Candidimonas nitroreducens TaxID=683354 RepID=A0A225N187_9BURK|nr:YigZ family protein [Candidimonas nitroreducens]OWT65621.1 thymidylate synthase [Candidimonas nitroreducens]